MIQSDKIEKDKKTLRQIKDDAEKKIEELDKIDKDFKKQKEAINELSKTLQSKASSFIESEPFKEFFKKPYVTIPYGKNQLLVAVPKFVKGFQMGWLFKETDSFYVYQLDQYSYWLGDVPEELEKELNLETPLNVDVRGQNLYFDKSQKEEVKQKLRKHINNVAENSARIIRGHEFQIIADMVKHNTLPFRQRPVDKEDIREGESNIELYNYQKPSFDNFMNYGAVGLFHPTGSGKSFVSMKAIDVIKGKKAIIVPTRSLIEQWEYYIQNYLPHLKNEVEIYTYASAHKIMHLDFALVIFDEVHRLPGNTFSKLALLKTKYRIGLSASPYREDDRQEYIFALTGYPQGLDWEEYMKASNRNHHPIYVHIVKTEQQKEKKVKELVNLTKTTLIFVHKLSPGEKISKHLNVPFIQGSTENKLDVIKNNDVIVASSVLDLGISMDSLQHIIEVDFLFGSRQQELQRTGRLMHSHSKDTRHDIIMTEHEMERYGKRLWALKEKGFKINVYEEGKKKIRK